MRTSKFLMLALLLAGVAVSFSSCQKDDATKEAPKIELKGGADGTIPITGEVSEGTVFAYITTAEGVKIKSAEYKITYLKADNSKGGDAAFKKMDFKKDGLIATQKIYSCEVVVPADAAKDAHLLIHVTDDNGKATDMDRTITFGTAPAPTGTAMQPAKVGCVNHAYGQGHAAFNFTKGETVTLDATADQDIISTATSGAAFNKTFKAVGTVKTFKLATKLDFEKATVEEVAKAIAGKTADATVTVAAGDQVVVSKGPVNYLLQIKEVTMDGYVELTSGTINTKTAAATAKGKGYIIFDYKASK